MIIKCTTCGSVYCIADKFVDSSERKVKCSKCNHIWSIKINNQNLINDEPNPLSFKWLNQFLAILLIVMNLLLFHHFWLRLPLIEKIYQYFDYYSSKDFQLDDLDFKMEKDVIFIKGTLINISDREHNLPFLRFRLLDRDKKIIFQYTDKISDLKLSAGSHYSINSKIINLTEEDVYLVLDYGNKIELILNK